MRRIATAAVASLLLSSACVPHQLVIPDPTVPHQVAKEVEVYVWARLPSGELARQHVRLLEGWWIAGPPCVEPEP